MIQLELNFKPFRPIDGLVEEPMLRRFQKLYPKTEYNWKIIGPRQNRMFEILIEKKP